MANLASEIKNAVKKQQERMSKAQGNEKTNIALEKVRSNFKAATDNIAVKYANKKYEEEKKAYEQYEKDTTRLKNRPSSAIQSEIDEMNAQIGAFTASKNKGFIGPVDEITVDFSNKKESADFLKKYKNLYVELDETIALENLYYGTASPDVDKEFKVAEEDYNNKLEYLSGLKQEYSAGKRNRLATDTVSDFEIEVAEFDLQRARTRYDSAKNTKIRRKNEDEALKLENEVKADKNWESIAEQGYANEENFLKYCDEIGVQNDTALVMTEEEKNTFNYLVGKYGIDAGHKYTKLKQHIFNERINKPKIEQFKKFGEEHPIMASVASTAAMPFAGIQALAGGIENNIRGALGDEQLYDPYDTIQMPQNIKNAMREGSKSNLGQVGSFIADVAYSIGDQLMTLPAGGMGSLLLMSGNAAGAKYSTEAAKGVGHGKALFSGIMSGAIEMATEKIGIDNLFKLLGGKSTNILLDIIKQSGTESIEEMASSYLNFIADENILKDNSDYQLLKKKLMIEEGLSEAEAQNRAGVEFLIKQPLLDAVAGAISGGTMGGSAATMGRLTAGAEMGDGYAYEIEKGRGAKEGTAYQRYAEKLGNNEGKTPSIWQKGKLAAEKAAYYEDSANVGYELQKEGKTGEVILEALSAPEGSKTRAMAEEIKTKTESGEEVSESEIGDLYNMLTTEKFKSSGTDFSETFSRDNYTAKLLSMGEEGIGAKEISVALSDLFAGREISTAAEDTIAKNSNAREILSNETGIEIKADFTEAQKVEAAREIISAVKGEANFKSGGDLAEVIRQDAAERAQANSKKDFGQAGQVAFESVLKKSTEANPDTNIDALYRGYTRYYEAGRVGLKYGSIPETTIGRAISEGIRLKAFASGVADAKAEVAKWGSGKEKSIHFGKKARLVVNDFSRNLSYQMQSDLNGLAKALGVQIEIVESVKGGQANGEYKDGVIRIAADANSPLLTTVAHEAVHRLKEMDIKAYNRLAKYVAQNYLMKGDSRRGSIAKATQKAYGEAGVELTLSEATEENVADFLANLVENRAEIRKLAGADLTLAQKVYKAIREVFEKVKAFFSGRSVDNAEIKKRYKALQMFEQEIAKVKNNARENLPDNKSETKTERKETAGKFEIKSKEEFENSKRVAVSENEFLGVVDLSLENELTNAVKGLRGAEKYKAIRDYILDALDNTIVFNDGIEAKVDRSDASHLASKAGHKKIAYLSKIREIIDSARLFSIINDVEHNKFDKFRYYQTTVRLEGEDYPIYLNVGHAKNGDGYHLYDITKKVGEVEKQNSVFERVNDLRSKNDSPTSKNISQSDKKVKRYSLKGVDTLGEFNKLTEQDRALKAKLDVKDRLIMDRRATMGQARRMVKDFGSRAKAGDVEEKIYSLYNKMLRGGDSKGPLAFNDFQKEARGIASEILKNVSVVDAYAKERYDDFLSNLKGRTIYISEADAADISDYNDFRNRYVFRLNLKKVDGYMGSGDYVDTIYSELAAAYPDLISGEAQAVSDMLYEIGEVIDSLSEYTKNPFEGDYLTESMLTNEILESFFDVPQAEATEEQKIINRLVAERVKIREQERERYEKRLESIEKVRAEHRAEIKETIKRERAKKDSAIEKIKERQKEVRSRQIKSDLIENIRTAHKHLSSMLLNPTDKKHIPKDLEETIRQFLILFDLTSTRTGEKGKEKMKELREKLEEFEADFGEYGLIDPDLKANFETVEDIVDNKKINEYTNKELWALERAIKAVEKFVRNRNKVFTKQKYAKISELAECVLKENSSEKIYTKSNIKIYEGLRTLKDFDMLDSFSFFDAMGDTLNDIFDSLRDGFDNYIEKIDLTREYIAEVAEKYGVKPHKLSGEGAEGIRIKLTSGNEIDIRKSQIMSIYALSKRKEAQSHLLYGGIEIGNEKIRKVTDESGEKVKYTAQGKVVKITAEDIGLMISKLSDKEKNFADDIAAFFTETARWGNEVSMELFGYEKYGGKNYFPIKVDDAYLDKNFAKKNGEKAEIKNASHTKPTKKEAKQPIKIYDIVDVYVAHTEKMALYNSFVLQLCDLQRVWNYIERNDSGEMVRSVKETIMSKYGEQALEFFDNFMEAVNGGVVGGGSGVIGALMSKAKASAVGWNLSVAIQQPTAIIRAMIEVNPVYFSAAAKMPFSWGQWEKIKKEVPIARWKDWGYYQFNIGNSTKDMILGKGDKLSDAAMWLSSKMDQVGWTIIYNAVEAETKHNMPELKKGSIEFKEAVRKRFNEVIDKTQVVDSVFHRSQLMRKSDSGVKQLTQYFAEPTKTYNIVWRAFHNHMWKERHIGKFGRTISFIAVSAIVTNMARAVIQALRDDEDKEWGEKWKEKFISNMKGEGFSYLPVIRELPSLFDGFKSTRTEMQGINEVVTQITKMSSKKETPAYAIFNLIAALGSANGWAFSRAKKEVEMIIRNVAGWTDSYYFEYLYTKQLYRIDNSENKSKFIDILYRSRENEEEFEKIKADLLKQEQFDEKYINGQINKRLKEDAAENKIVLSDYEKIKIELEDDMRFAGMPLRIQEEGLEKAKKYTTGVEVLDNEAYSGNIPLAERIEEGKEIGISPAQYILYELAYDMAKGDKKTLGVDEKFDVVEALDMSDEQKAFLYMSKGSDSSEKNQQKYEEVIAGGESIGLTGWEYIMFKELCRDADEAGDGNGKPTQKEVVAELSGADWLSREEKNYLMKVRWPKTTKTFF